MRPDYAYLALPRESHRSAAETARQRTQRIRRWLEWGSFVSASCCYIWALSLVAH